MPRTPLMRSLFKLAREHARAVRADLPVDAVREEQLRAKEQAARSGVSRRSLLAGAGIAAASLAVPRIARGSRAPRVAIVGGGIAGLNCALTLADAGVASTVYEASGRLGGRIFSNNSGFWNDGQVSEWGGELIDTGHETMQALAARFELPLADLHEAELPGSEETYFFFGKYYPKAQADRDFRPVYEALQRDTAAADYPTVYNSYTAAGYKLDHTSVYEWIEQNVPGGHRSPMGMLLDVAYTEEYAVSTHLSSALNIVYLLGFQPTETGFDLFGESDERFHTIGGNQQIPLAIARHLTSVGIEIKTGTRLDRIVQNSDGTYALELSGHGRCHTTIADHVVLAIPFTVLRHLDFRRAGFDNLKTYAITHSSGGKSGKLQLQFDKRYWYGPGPWPAHVSTGSSYSDTGYQNTWEVTRAQAGNSGILNNFTGAHVSESMTTDIPWGTTPNPDIITDAQRFLRQVEPVFPGISRHWNGKATSSLPHLDPNLRLSYSNWQVGQYTTFAGYEAVAQGNVHFAGEHCSIDFQGYMEGGANEGARAATEILDALGIAHGARPQAHARRAAR